MSEQDGTEPVVCGAEDPVVCGVEGGVATVCLNRPRAMNALTLRTKVALLAALRRVADDETVRAVVLTGTGRGFCVGQDLREHAADLRAATAGQNPAGQNRADQNRADQNRADGNRTDGNLADQSEADQSEAFQLGRTVREHYNPIVTLLSTMPKPVIAAVNGIAAGAGASFAFACDVRLVADSGGFNLAFADIGLSCDSGASWWLPRLVGVARAKDLLMFPRTVGSAEALELGLANRVVADDQLPAAAAELAAQLACGPTLAYAAVRRAVAFSQAHDLEASLANEAGLMDLTGSSADHRGAVEAFVAKQAPTFHGR